METVNFEQLEISEPILRAVTEMGFEEASPIQAKAIPAQMEGLDIIGQAQTGTGKTAAFGIPLLEKINPENKKFQAIILCPTRELAIQVSDEIRKLSKFMAGIKVLPVYGGQDITKQIRSLKMGVQIIVGTPGRVMDHMRRHTIKLEHIHTVVLDEADEMLNMGFRDDIETILKDTPGERQTVMFSATMPREIMEIAKTYQRTPVVVKVVKKELTVPKIEQYYYEVKSKNKLEVLCRLLDMYSPHLSLVFCNTKRQVDELVTNLQGRGYFAEGLHGDMKQSLRDRVMAGFRSGSTEILVATDVAARGIDVDDEYYVHRIGRTGRAGKEGRAFSLVIGREMYKLKDIMRYCKTKIYAQPIPSLNDVTQIKVEKTLDRMTEIIQENNLSSYVNMIEERINKEDYTAMDLAAAFLKASMGAEMEEIQEDRRGKRRYDRDRDTGAEEGMVRLFINIGKRQNIRPGDILGAIAGEANIPGKVVGSIDMYDKFSFVEVPYAYVNDVLNAMHNIKIKPVNIEPASGRR